MEKITSYSVWGFFLVIIINILFLTGNLFGLNLEFFTQLYFPLVWLGFGLFIDGLVYKFRGKSLIQNKTKDLLLLAVFSFLIWSGFEFIANCVQEWDYINIYDFSYLKYILLSSTIFAFALPCMFEIADLVNVLTSFRYRTSKYKVNKILLYLLIALGGVLFIIPIFYPDWIFPLIWISLFLVFDSINYLNGQPSIIKNILRSNWKIPVSLLVSGIFVGFLWEVWNYWSLTKWTKSVPFFDFYRSFDIPLLSYSLYFLFAWEIYSMYHFFRYIMKFSTILSKKK